MRQRAVVKVHYFPHGGGGGGALTAHVRYVAREAASSEQAREIAKGSNEGRAVAERPAEAERFNDAKDDKIDGFDRTVEWGRADRRHFRIILAPENGADLAELSSYTREVMARAEATLGRGLDWIAVDHWDTDNPHTHIILRGRDSAGRSLVLPRDFVKHWLRDLARDAATTRLGKRTPADERRALQREARAHRPTRLDSMLARQLDDDGRLRLSGVRAFADRDVENALKARARELQRLGLADEVRRGVLTFHADWQERLKAMELHLDHRKRIVRARTIASAPTKPGVLDR